MTNQHYPITPPPELVQQWVTEAHSKDAPPGTCPNTRIIINRAAQWGADQELDACCKWLNGGSMIDYDTAKLLRAARRPKPPSLAEEALAELGSVSTAFRIGYGGDLVCDSIRRALEKLQQLEDQQ